MQIARKIKPFYGATPFDCIPRKASGTPLRMLRLIQTEN